MSSTKSEQSEEAKQIAKGPAVGRAKAKQREQYLLHFQAKFKIKTGERDQYKFDPHFPSYSDIFQINNKLYLCRTIKLSFFAQNPR